MKINYTSGAAKLQFEENCALCEESMKFSHELVYSIGFNFRCGGKLDLTSEGGHLGFFKMAAMKIINCSILNKLDYRHV